MQVGPTTTLRLFSPVAGWATRLEEIPDAAFAQKMVGDGIAVDPTSSQLRAPCDGIIVSVHAARHACTLRAATGAELLLHVGIDTVNLRGEGFAVHIREGQRVRTGDALISFDMDLLARRARSLLTAMVVVNGEGYTVTERMLDREVSAGDLLLAVAGGTAEAGTVQAEGSIETAELHERLPMPHGLHARPAAVLARHARQHAATVNIKCKGRIVNGKSVVALLSLSAVHGDTLTISVQGEEARQVAQKLAEQVASGLGDPVQPVAEPPAGSAEEAPGSAAQPFAEGVEVLLQGTRAAPGVAAGQAVRVLEETLEVPEGGSGTAEEHQRLASALASVRRDIEAMIEKQGAGTAARADIFRAHLSLLDDPELTEAASREIGAGRSAAWAWRAVVEQHAQVLHGLDNPLLKERVGDLRDVGRRVIAQLTGRGGSRIPTELPRNAILVAGELLPSDLAAVPEGHLAALCTAQGGPTSHFAILAAGMGIPAVVAVGDAALRIPDGAPLIVDGDRGEARVFPPATVREATTRDLAARAARRATCLAAAHEDCRTADGVRIEVFANLGRPGDAAASVAQGAEGCGLLRTEFLFLERATAPSEDEQLAQYQEAADALRGRPLVIRTLDAGGDKPLAYLPLPREENPALGLRGVRVLLRHPGLLRTQLRAILRVKPAGVCRILVPMVTSVAELRAVRQQVEEERQALGTPATVALGAMIEVPIAAIQADRLAAEADFLSIGTNDLTQYALAMDRGNPHMAAHLDGLNPGVLRLVAQVVAGARTRGRPVAVCGGLASDPRAAPLLIGLGVTELSAAPGAIPELKAFIRTLALPQCADVAKKAVDLESGEEVRALVKSTWPAL